MPNSDPRTKDELLDEIDQLEQDNQDLQEQLDAIADMVSPPDGEVGHFDGYEENTRPKNLIWNCRACNTRLGVVFKSLGLGRRTHQYNPSGGAQSLGAWLAAVLSAKGDSNQMIVPDAVALIWWARVATAK